MKSEKSEKRSYSSSLFQTKTIKTKVAYYDLTVDSSKDEQKRYCRHCNWPKCHDILIGPFCVSAVQSYFNKDRRVANKEEARCEFVKAYGRKFEVHYWGATDELVDDTMTYPPVCVQTSSMAKAMKWFDENKKAVEENGHSEGWEHYESMAQDRKWGYK